MALFPRSNSNFPKKTAPSINYGLNALYLAMLAGLTQLAEAGDPAVPEPFPASQFNTSFLQGAASSVDLDLLLSANSVLPGNYRVDVFSNDVLVGRRDIDFRRVAKTGKVEACLTLETLQQLGINLSRREVADRLKAAAPDACHDLPALIDQATVNYDPSRLRLSITIPQISMQRGMRGYVDPALWDAGVPVGFINYQLSSNRNSTDSATTISMPGAM